MYTVPEWATVLLLVLYYVPLYAITGIGLKRNKEPKMAFWAPYLIFETCLLTVAFVTAGDISIVFVGLTVGMVLGLPLAAVAIINLIREELGSEESG